MVEFVSRADVRDAVLVDNVDRDFERARKTAFFDDDRAPLDGLIARYGWDAWMVSLGLARSAYRRRKRVKNKTSSIILGGCAIFVTMTFRNSVLASTSAETRRRYVARWLKANAKVYVANIDFGGRRGREHYHAIAWAEELPLKEWREQCGNVNVERIQMSELDVLKTAKYITKLSRHALKNGLEKSPRLIYSRKTL